MVLIICKINCLYTRLDKYALTSTLYIAFTTHLTNFFFSIPAVIINKFSYLSIAFGVFQDRDWLVATCVSIIGLLSVLNLWGLLEEVEIDDKEQYDRKDKYQRKKGKYDVPIK